MAADPQAFHVTDHYVGYPYLLVRLSGVHREDPRHLVELAWRSAAPRRLLAERE